MRLHNKKFLSKISKILAEDNKVFNFQNFLIYTFSNANNDFSVTMLETKRLLWYFIFEFNLVLHDSLTQKFIQG